MNRAASWTRKALLPEPLLVRKVAGLLLLILFSGSLAAPAYADQVDVDAARAAYKTAVASAVQTHKLAIARAQAEYQQALRTPAGAVAVANARAKALAEQATKASQAKLEFEQSLANMDRKAKTRAAKEYDARLRDIQQETEKALRDARAFGNPKTAREYAKFLRDQAFKTAHSELTKSLSDALKALNAVLIANGLPAEKG